jgi:DNA polymerase III delta prime subunit
MLPPEPRLPDARELVDEGQYFVVHAPRQTGKTTSLLALARDLTAEGRHVALRFSCEQAKWAQDDVGAAEAVMLAAIREESRAELPAEFWPPSPWPEAPPGALVREGLSAWARACSLPLVLFFDEIDALRDQSLISVLAQLRAGSSSRPGSFPASVVLCGLRDIRDYKAASGGDTSRLGTSSPFNVSVKSIRIGDFTWGQVAELYAQHTAETGQEFTPEAVRRAFDYTKGQPWLVNAIAREITREMRVKPPEPVTVEHVDEAKERLILARATHLDSLAARLAEARVRKVIEPLIAGELSAADPAYNDDVSYVRDLGLIREERPIAVANPIYREVIIRVLGERAADAVTVSPRSFLLPDGRLDFRKVLTEFAAFWRANGEILVSGEAYHEVAPQLVFMAFLQRIVNGGARGGKQSVEREYGVGRGRIDVLVRKPYTGADGNPAIQHEAVELKVRHPRRGDPLDDGLAQLDAYLSRLGLDSGSLVIFDRRPKALRGRPRTEITGTRTPEGRLVTLLRA